MMAAECSVSKPSETLGPRLWNGTLWVDPRSSIAGARTAAIGATLSFAMGSAKVGNP
jgi:hypothetical protein